MSSERASAKDSQVAVLLRGTGMAESIGITGVYHVECRDKFGRLKWHDTIKNLVTTVGKNDLLDKYLAGSAYTAAWYLGLIGATSYTTGAAAGDTSASHGGWVEDQNYSQGVRPTTAWSAASGGSKSLSAAAQFSVNATTTIKGCFLISNSTKGGTTGILYSAGLFTGGDKALANGDTLSVSYTGSA